MIYIDVNKVGSVAIDGTYGYWWAVDLTDSFKPINNQANPTSSCSSTYFIECYVFPEINYLIVNSKSNSNNFNHDVKITPGISQYNTVFVARIWQNGRFMGFDSITLSSSNWLEVVGAITSPIIDTLGYNDY